MLCAVCQNTEIRKAFVKQEKDFFRCVSCGLIFMHPMPSPHELKDHYDRSYYTPWQAQGGKMSDFKRHKTATFQKWISMIEKHVPKGHILDIGCAMGFFLEVAQVRGWEPYGLEVSEYSYAIAKQRFDNRIFQGDLLDAHFACDHFDAVTLFDVIEHESRPVETFKEIYRILKPGGILALSTMNTRSLSSRFMGEKWPHYKPEHLYCFSPSNMSLALRISGFDILEIKKAKKVLNLRYIHSYFQAYPAPVLTSLSRLIFEVLPKGLTDLGLTLGSGEMLVIARKKKN
ncbi:MAG: class I SAM-dependent methyltransferase [Candidatus Omnitrophota bacterium]